jgi:flagellar biosynthetic protein FliR
MITVTMVNQASVVSFWLCFSRMVAIIFQLPVFDNNSIPMIVKILASLLISYAFYPFVEPTLMSEVQSMGVDNFWWLTLFHTVVGLVIGFLVKSIMQIFLSAGTLMTQQIGFASINYFDPTHAARVGPFEIIIEWTLLIIIITSGALIPMFKGILMSFQNISIANVGDLANVHHYYLEFIKSLFGTSFLLASPILFSNLILNVILGIVARAIPQMNVLSVSFIINIGLGLLIFYAKVMNFFMWLIKCM